MDAHNHHGSRNVLSVKAQECPVFSTTVACMDTHSLQFWTGKLGRALDRECRVVWEEDKGHHENSKASRLLHIKSNSPNPRHHESHHLYCFLSQCTRGHCPENLVFDVLIGNNRAEGVPLHRQVLSHRCWGNSPAGLQDEGDEGNRPLPTHHVGQ